MGEPSLEQQNTRIESEEKVHSKEEDENAELETFVEQGIENAKIGVFDVESQGLMRVESASNAIDLPSETIEQVKADTDVVQKVFDFREKAQEVFDNTVASLKKIVAVGVSTVAIAGCAGEFKDTSIQTSDRVGYATQNKITYGEDERARMLAIIESPTYLERLTKETDGDMEEAKRIQQARLKSLQNSNIYYAKNLDELNAIVKELPGEKNLEGEVKAYSFVPYDSNQPVSVLLTEKIKPYQAVHELSHAATRIEKYIPKKTHINLKLMAKTSVVAQENIGYILSPTEALARKHVIEAKMENLGIKKYEEKFTYEHFLKLIRIELEQEGINPEDEKEVDEHIEKLINEDRLPEGIEFYLFYKTEDIETLFNETADVEQHSETSTTQNNTA